ncbi:hypothetical protein V8C42DRAFT_331968 [Trichoderma barbatum]
MRNILVTARATLPMMLILQPTAAAGDEGLGETLAKFQDLAKQIVCYAQDMECMPGNPELMRLCADLLSALSLQVDSLSHKNKLVSIFN